MLDILVQCHRHKAAAKTFCRMLLKGCRDVPRVTVADPLKRDGAAKPELLPGVEHRQHRYLNNRAENSHQPTPSGNGACRALTPQVTPSAFSPRMAPLPTTSARAGIGFPPPSTAKR